jgi:hypothetical protein
VFAAKTSHHEEGAKSSSKNPQSKLPRKAAAVRPLPAQPEEILFRVEGKMFTSGRPHDLGMADFAWQDGYAAFTVSQSQLNDVQRYVRSQGGAPSNENASAVN